MFTATLGLREDPCSAETRFQGIATLLEDGRRSLLLFPPCSAETRFQGIATRDARHVLPVPRSLTACSAETRFQGIATQTPSTYAFRHSSSCSAETRFQGIATRKSS